MRVLLPLKKKQSDDPNSQEQQSSEEQSYTEGEVVETYVEVTTDPAEAELAADTAATAAVVDSEGRAWTEGLPSVGEASPTAVLLSAAAARLSCLQQQPSSPASSSSEDSSSPPSELAVENTAEEVNSEARLGLEDTKKPAKLSSESVKEAEEALGAPTLLESTKVPAKNTEEEEEVASHAKTAAGACVSTPPAPSCSPVKAPTALGSSDTPVVPPATAIAAGSISVATLSTATEAATPSTPTATPATSTRAARKRRSSSPPTAGVDLNLKPPSKKLRDAKPPPTSSEPANDKKMAGGRGGRKVWTPPSYYVETSNHGAGRDDVVSSNGDTAEVDVRFTYRHENDPSSARGDMVIPMRAAAAASSCSNRETIAPRICGRDDEDVQRERESSADPRPQRSDDTDQQFAMVLKKGGLEIVEQDGDGNCLFRAISLQVYGDASMHGEVRQRCLDFMARDKEHFSQFITDEPFEQYIRRKRQDGVHGNNPEIQAISELFNRPIEVFVPENGASPLNIFHAEYKTQDAPIRLSYHDGNHYNAVIDPLVPTAGLGLGLPGLQPGLADKMQVAKAVAESDRLADQREYERALEESHNDQLQRAIKESSLSVDHLYQNKALSLSDCDATNFELEQAVLESSMESFRTFEHGRKQASKATSSISRRKRQASPPLKSSVTASGFAASSSVASIPHEERRDADSFPIAASAAYASPPVASAPAVASRPSNDDYRSSQAAAAAAGPMMAEHYPQTVQELVMNGFELRKVVHAYELVGDSFDDLLAFLMSNSGP